VIDVAVLLTSIFCHRISDRCQTDPKMSSMEKFLIGSYAGSLKDRLRGFDFQGYKGRVPSHILGHSVDFKYTIKAIDEYLDEVDGREDKNFEWNKWNALSPQEKQDFEGCIEILKRQQSLLKSSGNEGLDSPARMNVATVAASTAVAPPSSDGVESTKKKKKDSNVPSQSASDPWPAEGIDTAGSDSDDSSKDDSDVESFDFIERSVKTDNRWTEEEDRKLEKAVKSFKKQGKRPKWNFISERTFKGERSPGAVMQRWKTVRTLELVAILCISN
jgi:Myb-like DNA-binding domain